jgi:hypothetical protein
MREKIDEICFVEKRRKESGVVGFTDAVKWRAGKESAKGVDKGRNCGLAVGCVGEEFHQRWQLQTWLRRKGRWTTTKEAGIGTNAVRVVALVSRRGRGKRKREISRSIKEKWRPAEGNKRMYRT